MTTEQERKKLEQRLWAVKESAWELYRNAFWETGVHVLVKVVTDEVNKTLRALGFDHAVRMR